MIDLQANYSVIASRTKKSIIRELLKLTQKPGVISFAGGLPSPESFPIKEIEEITRDVLRENGAEALQYGLTEGHTDLRTAIAQWLVKDNIKVALDNIIVTTSSQQALDLIGRTFIDPDDTIIVELPSYIGGLGAFGAYGANMIGVRTDDNGMKVDILEKKLEELKTNNVKCKFIYVVPDFQNPAGVTLSLDRRKKLIQLSHKYDVLIIEDSPYRELRFTGETSPSLYSLDDGGNVIFISTFSKLLAPGLRLGWVMANSEVIKQLTIAKQSMDLCTPTLTQVIAGEFLYRGLLEPHIEKIKTLYKKKRDCMLEALKKFMPKHKGLHWTKPEGGLFLWLTLPETIDTEEMFFEAIEKNVAYVIGSAFHCDGTGHNTMRLNFSYPTENEIKEGIKHLSETVKAKLKEKILVEEPIL